MTLDAHTEYHYAVLTVIMLTVIMLTVVASSSHDISLSPGNTN